MRLLLVLVLLAGGCASGTQRIASASNEIRSLAESSKDRFVVLEEPQGVREQERIIALSDEVHAALPSVEPRDNPILSVIEVGSWAVVAVAIVFIVWNLGLGQLTRTLFSWVPRRKMAAAKLLDEAVSSSDETTIREAVAAMRAMDPDLDAAFRRQHAPSR